MTRDFSNPGKLGFLRLIQILFALNVVFSIAILSFVSKENTPIDLDFAMELLNLVLDGVCFWLIWKRMRAARWVVIALALLNIFVGTAVMIASGSLDLIDRLTSCSFDIVLLLYFCTSRRVKAILVQPFSREMHEQHVKEETELYQPKTWRFWRNVIIYFCIFSIVGHWMEAGYCTLIRFGLIPGIYDPNSGIWRDWFYPFLVYGVGAAFCILLFYPVKLWLQRKFTSPFAALVLSFAFNAIVCSLIELAMGLVLNQPLPDGSMPLWDYRNMFCNFMGQICLQNAVAFGMVATLLTWVLYPLLEKFLGRFSMSAVNVAFIAIVIAFSVLFFFYCINVALPDVQDDGLRNNSTYEKVDASSDTSADGKKVLLRIGGNGESDPGLTITAG